MQAISEAIGSVACGLLQTYRNLTVTPLLASGTEAADYFTLDEALVKSTIRVTEIPEVANVSELYLENHTQRAVLLLDGEELVGAMQNRVLNLSVLASAFEAITIPVTCVESGRWSLSTPEFHSESRVFYAAGRAQNAEQVTEALRIAGSRKSCQQAVWRDIEDKLARMESQTHSGAMSAMYEDYATALKGYIEAFESVPNQAGAIFQINEQVRGLELFDSPETFRKLMPKLIQSYALDALDDWGEVTPTVSDTNFLNIIADTPTQQFPSLGEGDDIRFTSKRVVGGALSVRDRIIHLAAFLLKRRRN